MHHWGRISIRHLGKGAIAGEAALAGQISLCGAGHASQKLQRNRRSLAIMKFDDLIGTPSPPIQIGGSIRQTHGNELSRWSV